MKKDIKSFRINRWPDKTTWFLTDSTYLHFPYFNTVEQKEIILKQFKNIREKLGVSFSDFSISKNHYHTKFFLENGTIMKKVKQFLRGGISREYGKRFKMKYNKLWHSRRIIPIKSDNMDWKVSGYIMGNLLKHREVDNFHDLLKFPYSSFGYKVKKYGEEDMKRIIMEVIGVNESAWGEIDLDELRDLQLK